MTVGKDGSVSFTDNEVGGYTAKTAPIVFQNSNGGWRSGSPKGPEYADALSAGMIYVSCGSRSRDAVQEDGTVTGKAPVPVADLKAGVIAIRANADVIPGNKDRIISVGASGGGQMSSALGATGNMEEYYPYLYEAGAIGVTYDEATDTYSSEYDDSVYGAMAYCPIADIENADLAYAWLRYDSTMNADGITKQTYLVNATQIMLDVAAGKQDADIAQYWRTRNGTADQHTSFSVAYNICLAAQMAGSESDYALVWAMGHGSNEGTVTGTFVDWIHKICSAD